MATASDGKSSGCASSGCISSLTGVLTIVFVVLKLTHEITWSWWLVLAPAWVCGVFALAIFAIAAGAIGRALKGLLS